MGRVDHRLGPGPLITKQEAISRLDRFGVPGDLVAEIARRRAGEHPTLTGPARLRRAHTARRLVARGIQAVTQPDQPTPG